MKQRIEAATNGFHGAMDQPWSEPGDWTGEVTAALNAADAVMFSDEAVERAARALYATEAFPIYDEAKEEFAGEKPWEWLNEKLWDSYRTKAHAVIAALKGDA